MTWDFCETNPLSGSTGDYNGAIEWIAKNASSLLKAGEVKSKVVVKKDDAKEFQDPGVDLIVTDPPYYDAIPYADLTDFFYIWQRRLIGDLFPEIFQSRTIIKDNELALRLPHSEIANDHTSSWYRGGNGSSFLPGL